ncbi:MAG: metallophosphoesterase family protein [Pirellulaceae bacterium]
MIHFLRRRVVTIVGLILFVLVAAGPAARSSAPLEAWQPGNGRAEFRPFTFVHLGDPQIGFGRDGAENDHARLVQAGKQINACKPDFVCLAGDLTNKNLPREEELLEAGLQTFEPPRVAAPGNHDAMTHQALAEFRRRWGKDYQVFTHNGCDFVVVNSLLLSEQGTWFEQKDDAFRQETETQWKWLEATLAQSAQAGRTHVFLLMHVPPFLKLEQEPDGYENLPSTARHRLLDVARQHGVRAILCGHNHANLEVPADSKPTIWTAGGTARVGEGEQLGFHVWHVEQDKVWREFVELSPVVPAPTAPPATPATPIQSDGAK